jgi:LacI family transcriptional regulator
LKQIAQEAGVSAALVSMILHGKGRASKPVRQAVLTRLHRAGYQPRLRVSPILAVMDPARLVSSGKSLNTIEQIQGLQEALASEGLTLQIETVNDPETSAGREQIDALARRKPGGVVLPTDFPGLSEALDSVARAGLVAVQMGYDTEDPRRPGAVVDSFAGMYSAVRMLLSRGHRRIGTIRWQAGLASVNSNKKHAGFLAALADAGLAPDPADIQTISACQDEPGWVPASALLDRMLKQPDPPTALVVENSYVSLSLLVGTGNDGGDDPSRGLETVHFEDWPLSPVDDIFRGKLMAQPLQTTLVSIPWRQIGQMAGRLMIESLRDGDPNQQTILRISPKLVRMRGNERTNLHLEPGKEGTQ